MGTFKVAFAIAYMLLPMSCCGVNAPIVLNAFPQHIPYLVHIGNLDTALALYERAYQRCGFHDTECLERIGLSLLQQGADNSDPEVVLLTLYGAAISLDERAFDHIAKSLSSPTLSLQVAALNLLARIDSDSADKALLTALQSNSFAVRFEAAVYLAHRHYRGVTSHIASLMGKVDDRLWPLFCPLYASIGDGEALALLRCMLSHPSEEVRIATILSFASANRDDFLSKIKVLASHPSPRQREACAVAFRKLKDSSALPFLQQWAFSSMAPLRLTSLHALSYFGDLDAAAAIGAEALGGSLFAISLLGDIGGKEDLLSTLLESGDLNVRINACLALLKLGDGRSVGVLKELLIKDARDLAFERISSPGGGCSYWKAVPSAEQNLGNLQLQLEKSLIFREDLLSSAVSLPPESFFSLAEAIMEAQESDLIPLLTAELEALASPRAIDLLNRYQQKAGAPLLRHWCNLALYRLREKGPYGENLKAWVRQQRGSELIQLRPQLGTESCDEMRFRQITPHETSRLLIESFVSFAQRQDCEGINMLIEAIRHGNKKNKYALAGLLIRASR